MSVASPEDFGPPSSHPLQPSQLWPVLRGRPLALRLVAGMRPVLEGYPRALRLVAGMRPVLRGRLFTLRLMATIRASDLVALSPRAPSSSGKWSERAVLDSQGRFGHYYECSSRLLLAVCSHFQPNGVGQMNKLSSTHCQKKGAPDPRAVDHTQRWRAGLPLGQLNE